MFPDLDDAFGHLLRDYTAGDPMRPGVRWTNWSLRRIRDALRSRGFHVGVTAVTPLLRQQGLGRVHGSIPREAQIDDGAIQPTTQDGGVNHVGPRRAIWGN